MVTNQNLDDYCLNKSETGRFPLELIYPLRFVECNCTLSQGEYYPRLSSKGGMKDNN